MHWAPRSPPGAATPPAEPDGAGRYWTPTWRWLSGSSAAAAGPAEARHASGPSGRAERASGCQHRVPRAGPPARRDGPSVPGRPRSSRRPVTTSGRRSSSSSRGAARGRLVLPRRSGVRRLPTRAVAGRALRRCPPVTRRLRVRPARRCALRRARAPAQVPALRPAPWRRAHAGRPLRSRPHGSGSPVRRSAWANLTRGRRPLHHAHEVAGQVRSAGHRRRHDRVTRRRIGRDAAGIHTDPPAPDGWSACQETVPSATVRGCRSSRDDARPVEPSAG